MAIWRRRSKAGPSDASKAGKGAASGLNGVAELRGELESLKAELSSAQAEASEREQAPPHRSRRGVAVAAGVVTVGAGVTAGLLVSDHGSKSRVAAPVTEAPAAQPSTPPTHPPVTSQPSTPSATPPATEAAPTTQPSPPATPEPATTPASPTPRGQQRTGGLIVVQSGQSFWSIAEAVESQALGRVPSNGEVGRYWLSVVAANAPRLVRPGDPDLLYVGQEILLPPL